MSKWIKAESLIKRFNSYVGFTTRSDQARAIKIIEEEPSLDLITCVECEYIRYCESEDLDLYLDCDCPDGGGIPRDENWYCADAKRRES